MPKYRRKPIVLWAERWWPDCPVEGVRPNGDGGGYLVTLEGPMLVRPGDYIVTGISGERYPVRADIFERIYEEIKE